MTKLPKWKAQSRVESWNKRYSDNYASREMCEEEKKSVLAQ